jgi:hypothetical protein
MFSFVLLCFVLFSLSYHFGFLPDRRSSAFRYAVEAGDEMICRGAAFDALPLIQKAIGMVVSAIDANILIAVIDSALQHLKPAGVVAKVLRRLSSVNAPPQNPSLSNQLSQMEQTQRQEELLSEYNSLRAYLVEILPALEEVDAKDAAEAKAANAGCFGFF